MYKVLLYYQFSPVKDADDFCHTHREKCLALNLFGRIYIAHEGINGTVGGTIEQIKEYKAYLTSLPGFEYTEFKEDDCDKMPFIKLIVKTRLEIVSLKTTEKFDVHKEGGEHLSPQVWAEILESDENSLMAEIDSSKLYPEPLTIVFRRANPK